MKEFGKTGLSVIHSAQGTDGITEDGNRNKFSLL